MALQSPGVEVTVIDESFYTPAEPGTTPLIVIATAENKTNAAGTGTAAGTLATNISRAFRVTSQRELVDLYGVPFFEKTASSSPVHGGERNEYGLMAAYSLLGVTNSVFVTRANVDLNELQGQTAAPGAEPKDGAWWFDTRNTSWGIQEWNSSPASFTGGQKFASKTPIVLTNVDTNRLDGNAPAASVGSIGDYCVVALTVDTVDGFIEENEQITFYYKSAGNITTGIAAGEWVLIGSEDWFLSHPVTVSRSAVTSVISSGVITINGNDIELEDDTVDSVATKINTASIAGVVAVSKNNRLYIYSDGTSDAYGDSSLLNAVNISGDEDVLSDLDIAQGVYYGVALQQTPHTQVPEWKGELGGTPSGTNLPRPTGSVWVKTTEPNAGSRWRVKRWSKDSKSWVEFSAPLYASGHAALYFLDRAGGGANIPVGNVFVQFNADEHAGFDTSPETTKFRIWTRVSTRETVIKSNPIGLGTITPSGPVTFTLSEFIKGELALGPAEEVGFTASGTKDDAQAMAAAINAVGFQYIEADVTADNEVIIYHKTGGDFRLADGTGTPLSDVFTAFNIDTGSGTVNLYQASAGSEFDFVASNWMPLAVRQFAASNDQPLQMPDDGQLWYNPTFGDVDIMVHNGTTWVGYRDSTAFPGTDLNGPQVSASEPETQSDGITALVNGDLWISTADLENYPTIYRWDDPNKEWALVDKTDQTTEDGILFADARYGLSGATGNDAASIKQLLTINYLDPDAPDPDLYPKGMMLWNLRRSGGNVKRYAVDYINRGLNNTRFNNGESMAAYAVNRWVTASPNAEDGSGTFGRKAQRAVIVQSLKSVVDTSEEIRDEERRNFNLIACPGYPELLSNLINLNIDRGLTAFVVGDTPMRLRSDATTLTSWATNDNGVFDNGDDGLVSFDEYAAVWYPNGFTTDLGGANIVVPASHMMLRTIALSDQVSYPWFAPAGTRRGGITNATSVGFIDASTGEFRTVALNNGQRDTLYDLKMNPIPFFVGVGHVAYGQKTLARNASALDRINVARLVVYLRSQLNKLARPYIFEPNDKITRDEIKGAVESLLLELVGLRALYDFAVVCDDSNNTPARIDRNELYVDIAIEPVKAVEFIYIPLRIQNTGEI